MNILLSKPAPMPYERPPLGSSREAIHQGLLAYFQRWLDRDDLQFEARFLSTDGGGCSGAFFNLDPAGIQAAAELVFQQDSNPRWKGIYTTINPAPRTTAARGVLSKTLTKDKDILEGRCHSLLVDIDPERPEGFGTWNATVEEVAWAQAAGTFILDLLPLIPSTISHSGNGFQAIYPLEGISAEDHKLVLGWLDSCLQEYSYLSGKAQVDTKVYNPGRIWRLLGTHGRKLGNGVDRPKEVKAILLREPARSEDLPRMLSDNQQEIEALIAEIKAEREKAPPRIASVERSTPKVTEEPSKKAGCESLILKVTATDWMERAKRYVAKIRPGIAGQIGHNATLAAGCKILQKFPMLDENQHRELLRLYNESCQPPWNEWELNRKFREAQKKTAEKVIHQPFTEESDIESDNDAAEVPVDTDNDGANVSVAEEWLPLPKEPQKKTVTPFPVDCLPKPARDFVDAVSQGMSCDPGMPAMGVLGAMASSTGGSSTLEIASGWRENASLWLGIVAGAGSAKTPTLSACLKPIRQIQSELSSKHRMAMKSYQDAKERAKVDKNAPLDCDKPTAEFILVHDATSEALVGILAGSPRGCLQSSDELIGWVKGHNQYKSKGCDRENYLSLWSSQPISVHRKTDSQGVISVVRPIHTIIGNLVPDRLPELNSGSADGLVERFLLCKPASVPRKFNHDGVSTMATDAYGRFIYGLWQQEPEAVNPDGMAPRIVALSEDARKLFGGFYDEVLAQAQDEELPPLLKGALSKMPSQAGRLALILHCGRQVAGEENDPHRLSVDCMDAAIQLCRFFMAQGKALVGVFNRGLTKVELVQERILAWISRHKKQIVLQNNGKAQWRNLRHDVRSTLTPAGGLPDNRLFEEALQALEAQGYIRLRYEDQDKTPARRPIIECNPELLLYE